MASINDLKAAAVACWEGLFCVRVERMKQAVRTFEQGIVIIPSRFQPVYLSNPSPPPPSPQQYSLLPFTSLRSRCHVMLRVSVTQQTHGKWYVTAVCSAEFIRIKKKNLHIVSSNLYSVEYKGN